jgi:hypothetical protein
MDGFVSIDLHRLLILIYVPLVSPINCETYVVSLHQKEWICFEQELTLTVIYIVILYFREDELPEFLSNIIDEPHLLHHILRMILYDLNTPFYIVTCIERF